MTQQAVGLAEKYHLDIEVLGPEDMEKRGMGGILAVGAGSSKPPRMPSLRLVEMVGSPFSIRRRNTCSATSVRKYSGSQQTC